MEVHNLRELHTHSPIVQTKCYTNLAHLKFPLSLMCFFFSLASFSSRTKKTHKDNGDYGIEVNYFDLSANIKFWN